MGWSLGSFGGGQRFERGSVVRYVECKSPLKKQGMYHIYRDIQLRSSASATHMLR